VTPPLLQVDGLDGGYGPAPVLRGVSLTAAAGEIVGVLGANGAGKTTLLRALSGTLPVWRGTITLDGRSLGRLSPWKRVAAGLVHVPEGRHVFGAMTVRDNLEVAALAGRRGQRGNAVSLDQVFKLFPRLAQRQRQAAGHLSGGEQQMLAVGRALVTGARVLVIDEMSAGLAPVIVHQLVDGLVTLRADGVAVILVEQSPHFIAAAVDRVYLLEQGRVVGAGAMADLGGPDRLADLYLGVR
jgi:branched-chain amino acid transport system ATP-binding protein